MKSSNVFRVRDLNGKLVLFDYGSDVKAMSFYNDQIPFKKRPWFAGYSLQMTFPSLPTDNQQTIAWLVSHQFVHAIVLWIPAQGVSRSSSVSRSPPGVATLLTSFGD